MPTRFADPSSPGCVARTPRLAGTPGLALAFAWGAAEASFFFLVPDIFLSWVAMKAPRRVWMHLALAVSGALLAGGLMFAWASRTTLAREFVAAVPRVSAVMFDQADDDLRRHGALGSVIGPARGVPYKVYAVQAPSHGISAGAFLAASVPARVWRMLATVLAFAAVGVVLRRLGRQRWGTPLHMVFWVVSVTAYWIGIG
jgi:hypothetical protein